MRSLGLLIAVAACGGGSAAPAVEPVENTGAPPPPVDPCAQLDGIIAAAPGNFLAIRGDEVPQRLAYRITIDLPGGACELAYIGGLDVVTCEMSGTHAEVEAHVQACLDRPPSSSENGLVDWDLPDGVRVSVSTELDDIRLYVTHPDDEASR